jgi:hypothetical protein
MALLQKDVNREITDNACFKIPAVFVNVGAPKFKTIAVEMKNNAMLGVE